MNQTFLSRTLNKIVTFRLALVFRLNGIEILNPIFFKNIFTKIKQELKTEKLCKGSKQD